MTNDKCPNCGGAFVGTARDFIGTKICHDCKYKWVPGRPDLMPIDWKARAEKAEAELAKRERALEEINKVGWTISGNFANTLRGGAGGNHEFSQAKKKEGGKKNG